MKRISKSFKRVKTINNLSLELKKNIKVLKAYLEKE